MGGPAQRAGLRSNKKLQDESTRERRTSASNSSLPRNQRTVDKSVLNSTPLDFATLIRGIAHTDWRDPALIAFEDFSNCGRIPFELTSVLKLLVAARPGPSGPGHPYAFT